MGMNPGRLNRRIQIRRFIETGADGHGGVMGAWADYGPMQFAQRRDVSDAERYGAGKFDNKLVVRFTVRASAFARTIQRSDQIDHDGITFGIDGIKEVPPGLSFLEITAWSDDVA